MPQILTHCPELKKSVSTRLSTEQIKFDPLSGMQFLLICPACGKIHRWKHSRLGYRANQTSRPPIVLIQIRF